MDNRGTYVEISTNDTSSNVTKWTILRRQILVCSAVWSTFFSLGLLIGTPTIYIAQIRKQDNSTVHLSNEIISWIGSASNYSSVPFLCIITAVSKRYGRKIAFLFGSLTSAIGFIIIFFSTSVKVLLIGEFILGNLIACDFIVCALVITEYTSPKYRGVFLTLKSSIFAGGVLVANSMGLFIHWTSIPLLGSMCTIYSFLVGLLWPESPYWLASKEDYSSCSNSHYWLKGRSKESIEELNSLLKTYENLFQAKKSNCEKKNIISFFKQFYRFHLYSILMVCSYHFFGKMAFSVYIIQIVRSVVKSETMTCYGTIIIDIVSVFSMFTASVASRLYNRKIMLLISSLITILSLFALSIYMYVLEMKVINDNKYIFLVILSLYMVAVSCGPIILIPSANIELCPLRYRGLHMLFLGLFGNIVMGSVLKFTPFLFSLAGSHGAFFFFGVVSLVLAVLVYWLIPETKDQTITEINNVIRR